MLCSKCSKIVKPVVAIDIDGTIGDYHRHFLHFAGEYLDGAGTTALLAATIDMYGGEEPWSDYCCRLFSIDKTMYRQVKLAYRQGGMKRTMPIMFGAQALCWAVIDAGAELWMTTTRPYLSLDNVIPDTVEWLNRVEIPYDGLLFDEDKYAVLADRVDSRRVVAVLDDLPEMYDAAARAFGEHVPILVMGKFNASVRRTMMSTLDASADVVLKRIQDWEGA